MHDNCGPGLWTDINNFNVRYEDNDVYFNTGSGIFHEISYAAVIINNRSHDNTVTRNGCQGRLGGWCGGSQCLGNIYVANSCNVEITCNVLSGEGTRIHIVQQTRGTGNQSCGTGFGNTFLSINTNVHDNIGASCVFVGVDYRVSDFNANNSQLGARC